MNIKRKDICWLALFMFLLVPNLALAYGGYGEIFLMSLGLIVIGITTIIIYIAINTLIKMLFMKIPLLFIPKILLKKFTSCVWNSVIKNFLWWMKITNYWV